MIYQSIEDAKADLERLKKSGLLVEVFTIRVPGRNLMGELFRTPFRGTGRRIIVTEYGIPMFDTDECYDLGNARNKLELWLSKITRKEVNHG